MSRRRGWRGSGREPLSEQPEPRARPVPCAAAARRLAAQRGPLEAEQLLTLHPPRTGGEHELLAHCVELAETSHPELWQGSPEQLVLTEQLRASGRLVHVLSKAASDFGPADVR